MSFSVTGVPPSPSDFAQNDQPPVPTPTLSQQAHILASSGHTITQIAVTLVVPAVQVDSALGIPAPSTTSDVAPANLSVHI